MSPQDQALLAPHLEPVTLDLRQQIETPDNEIEHAYFPDSGIISVVARSAGGQQIEAGIVGREGMTGLPIVMGNHRSPNDTYVQVAGAGRRIAAEHLRAAIAQSPTLRHLLLRFAQTFMVLVAQTALANGRAHIEERLARWLLMARDRGDSDELTLTHEFMALMLGVRRSGVTNALHALEGKGLLRAERGSVCIVDRAGLVTVAGGAYGVPEAEYLRLIG